MIGVGIGIKTGARTKSPEPIILLRDSFTRADNATAMGRAETGQDWVSGNYSIFGIIDNKAYSPSDNNGSMINANVTKKDYKISVALNGHVSSTSNFRIPSIIFKYADINNMLLIRPQAGSIMFYKIVAGVVTLLASPAVTTPDNFFVTMTIACTGSSITVTYNGLVFTYTLSGNELALIDNLGIGLRLAKGGAPAYQAYWDDLIVEAL